MKRFTNFIRNTLFALCFFTIHGFSQDTTVSSQQPDTIKRIETQKDLAYGFSIAIGGRFSFLDKPFSNDLYYDISAFYPSAFQIGKKKRNIGIDFGLFETGISRELMWDQEKISYTIFNEPGLYAKINSDSVLLVNRTFKREATLLKPIGLGLYFSPTFEVSKKCYILLDFAHYYYSYSRSFNDQIIQSDTMKVSIGFYESLNKPISSFGSDRHEKYYGDRTFIGLGGIFFFDFGEITFRIKPTIGYQFSDHNVFGNTNFLMDDFPGDFLYFNIDFRFIESKKYGIKIGGDVRGKVTKYSSYVLTPSIYLSKIFDLSKIVEFVIR